ncbi:MAG: 2-dehydropantoate 2-reductase [Acidimicrobiaceae bacterium]|jgi:2-dehydropantoate 2-reductase
MRFVVFGAGGVGGVLGGRLHQQGHDVVLIARGAHGEAIRNSGLQVESPEGAVMLSIETVAAPSDVGWKDGDIALLSMKSQDTANALRDLVDVASRDTPVVCVQNGVANERMALRLFPIVYGVCVMCPTSYLQPGVVQAHSTPVTGIMDIGRVPSGADATATAIAGAFSESTYFSEARPDIMRWKHQKLLMNLSNAIEAACGPSARGSEVAARAKAEGIAVFQAAGIDYASDEEDAARRGDHLRLRPIGEQRRGGGSTWQSLARGAGTLETDFLNGEIVLLGRQYGVPTPVNELLQQLARELVMAGAPPGSLSADSVLARLSPAEGGILPAET